MPARCPRGRTAHGLRARPASRPVDRLHLAGEPQPGLPRAREAARGRADPRGRGGAARRPRLRADRRRSRRGAPLAARDGAVADGPRRGVAAALLPLAARAGGGRGVPARRGRARPRDAGGVGGRSPRSEDPDTPKTRAYRIALELGLRHDEGAARRGRDGALTAFARRSRVTTITSSTRTPKRPSTRIDGSSVNVIPASSGVSSSTERNGRSCTSSPIPCPIRWRKPSP